jgi:hypothetical protein
VTQSRKVKIIDSMAKHYIELETKWSKVKGGSINYEDNTDMDCIFVWIEEDNQIIEGWTIHYEPVEDSFEEELSNDFDDFLDGFLKEEDEEN